LKILYFIIILQNFQKSGTVSQILYPRTGAIEIQLFNTNSYIELGLIAAWELGYFSERT